MYGYWGRALHIDLGDGSRWEEEISAPVLRSVVGGVGLGTYLLYRHCPPSADPLGPENPLIFATSPFVGTAITTSAKYAVLAKSPLTGFIGDSLSGSHLAVELKRTGYDALVLHGACPDWQTLRIVDGAVELHPADHLLGLETWPTETAVHKQLGPGRVAVIGPAGERLVRFATISNDGRSIQACRASNPSSAEPGKVATIRGGSSPHFSATASTKSLATM